MWSAPCPRHTPLAALRLLAPLSFHERGVGSELSVCVGVETDDGIGVGGYDYGTTDQAGFLKHGFDEFVIGDRVAAVAVWFGAGASP